jgi:hypothetical protein
MLAILTVKPISLLYYRHQVQVSEVLHVSEVLQASEVLQVSEVSKVSQASEVQVSEVLPLLFGPRVLTLYELPIPL